jgi:hypothetical protein
MKLLAAYRRWRRVLEWHRLREVIKMAVRSTSCESGPITLHYPPLSWYAENANEMLGILAQTAGKLEKALGLSLPKTDCYVVQPETVEIIEGAAGAAYRDLIIVGVPERELSTLAGVGAHELAHILSYRVGRYEPPFKGEGFACYAASLIHAQTMPMDIPLHHHLAWLLAVGVKPRLEELWQRQDYTPELYDLAWSFAASLAGQFGQERYYRFYGSRTAELSRRVEDELGISLAHLESDWWETARRSVTGDPRRISRAHRYDGCICSRAAWLARRAGETPVPRGPLSR